MNYKYALIAIIAIGVILRLINLGGHDVVGDESPNAMRAIGLVDYVAATDRQSTPVSWFPDPVWWQYLSFHDAPPLVIWVQHIFISILGDSVWAIRLSFVVVGILSIYAIFLLGRLLGGLYLGLVSAGVMAIMNYAVWASRMQFLDGYLILFISLSLYFFIRALEAPRNYLYWGIFTALGILTKYTFFFMGPVFLIALFISHRSAWREKWFYVGCAALLILVTPLIIYNFMMSATRGHLDAALSTLIGDHPEDFKGLTRGAGKDFNFLGIINAIIISNLTWGFQILLALGLAFFSYPSFVRMRGMRRFELQPNDLIILGFLWGLIMLTVVGNHDRFGLVLAPFMAIFIAYGVWWIYQRLLGAPVRDSSPMAHNDKGVGLLRPAASGLAMTVFTVVMVILAAWELFFAVQSNLMADPPLKHRLFLDQSRPHFGVYNDLENYVARFYKQFPEPSSVIMFTAEPQLAKYQAARLAKIPIQAPRQTHLLVFDDRIDWFAFVWIFERRKLYDSSPIHSITQFTEKIAEKGAEYYKNLGLKDVTFIMAADYALEAEMKQSPLVTNVVKQIEMAYKPIEEIKDRKEFVAFRVYRVPL